MSEVERVTKIRVKFLRAMEEDRWEALPAPVYARSFLTTYARFLGLEEDALLEEYGRTVEGADRAEPIPVGVVRAGAVRPGRLVKPFGFLVAASVTAALVGLVVVVVVAGLSDGGDDRGGRQAPATGKGPGAPPASTATQPGTVSSELSVQLRATAEVWVCLVDAEGRRLVNGEVLAVDEQRGPFTARGFEMTFGNGSIELAVDGEPIEVPPLAEPLGYRVTASSARRIAPDARPSCL